MLECCEGMVKVKGEREREEGEIKRHTFYTLTAGQDLHQQTAHLLNYRHRLPHHRQGNRPLINPSGKGDGGINDRNSPPRTVLSG